MIWWFVLVVQLIYGKFLVGSLKHKSLWTPVLYTNTFSVLPALTIGFIGGELSEQRLSTVNLDGTATFWLLLSCLIGIGISWAGFWCQSVVTATTYSVVGVMNKMLTVTVNVLIWDKHATLPGIASLCVCLLGGSLYQQSPLRPDAVQEDPEERALNSIVDKDDQEYKESDEELPTTYSNPASPRSKPAATF